MEVFVSVWAVLLIRSSVRLTHGFLFLLELDFAVEADVWSLRDVRGLSGECSDQLAVLLCRVLLKCGERLMCRVAAGEDPVVRLDCLPNVAGVPAGSLGGATGFCYLSGGRRRLVAVVVAPLLLSLVVFLRLESGWDVRFDLTVD